MNHILQNKTLATITTLILILSTLATLTPLLVAHGAAGTITASQSTFSENVTLQITVTDPDLPLTPATNQLVSIRAEYDNEVVNLNASQIVGGAWVCWVTVNGSQPQNPPIFLWGSETYATNRLTTPPSDGSEVKFIYFDASENQERVVTVTYKEVKGSISLDRTAYPMQGKVYITVTDPDMNVDPTKADTIQAGNLTIKIADYWTLTAPELTETGPNTQTFKGSTILPVNPPTYAMPGQRITVTYKDPAKGDVTAYGIVTVSTAEVSLDKAVYMVNDTAKITLVEPDLNKDSDKAENVTVTVKSDKLGGRLDVKLDETGKNTGRFTGTFKFAIEPTPGRLNVTAKDKVIVNYTDPLTATGDMNVVRTAKADFTTNTGVVSLDRTVYSPNMMGYITVVDPDMNVNPDAIDYLGTPVTQSLVAVNSVKADGTAVDTEKVLMTEYGGTNTGIFVGRFKTSTTASASGNIPTVQVSIGGKIKVTYTDPITADGETNKAISKEASIRATTGTVELGRPVYSPNVRVTVRITDPDLNLDVYSKDTIIVGKVGDKWQLNITNNVIAQPGVTLGEYTEAPVVLYSTGWDGTSITNIEETDVNTGIFEKVVNAHIGNVKAGETLYFKYIDPANEIGVQEPVVASARLDTFTGTLTIDKSVYKVGEKVKITVVDPDMNKDPKAKDEITDRVTIKSDTSPGGSTVKLTETDKDTDTFTGEVKLVTGTPGTGELKVSRGDTVTVTYEDQETAGGGGKLKITASAKVYSSDGKIELDRSSYSPYGTVKITVTDPDMNADSAVVDSIAKDRIRIYTTSDPYGIEVTLKETDVDTGIFEEYVKLGDKTDEAAKMLKASHGDGLTAVYTEEADAAGKKDVARMVTAKVSYVTAKISFDKSFYLINETAKITLVEPDENKDAKLENSVQITVTSTTDPAGIRISLTETGKDTGIFEGSLTFTTGPSTGTMLKVTKGDTITAIYDDRSIEDYPTVTVKRVTATAKIGVPVIAKPIIAGTPVAADPTTGEPLTEVTAGSMVLISTAMTNTAEEDVSMLYIVQVKDAAGHVVFLSFISGTVPAGKTYTMGISWTPTAPGTYTVEVFAWRSWDEPAPLSDVATATITVV